MGSTQRDLALAHIQSEVPRAIELNPELPVALSNVIYKVMSKRPNDRYKHADQLGHILQQVRERRRSSAQQTAAGRMAPPTLTGQQSVASSPAPVPRRSPNYSMPGAASAPFAPRRANLAPAPQHSAVGGAPAQERGVASGRTPVPHPPNPLFNPDGTINVDATGGYSGPFLPQRQAKGEGADIVTIMLVILAFLAVAGLAPLYILGVFPLI